MVQPGSSRPERPSSPPATRRQLLFLLLIVLAVVAAYRNSFSGAFLLDDDALIVDNQKMHHLWPLRDVVGGTERPLVFLTFALNYVLGQQDVWGYHLVNLILHLSAALTLFGLVRRTVLLPGLRERYGPLASWLAVAVALIWAIHPLQTNSVTYIVQRSEVLMGLCYLLTLYGMVRSAEGSSPRRWAVSAVTACALGMLSKPVMVTAPLAVLLYDRTFLAGSVRQALRQRRPLYLGLLLTWTVLLTVLLTCGALQATSAGVGVRTITALQYARTQPGVLLYYLRLAVWPHPLVFDYGWPIATKVGEILPQSLAIGALLLTTVWALVRYPAWGFLSAWFFLTIVPSSSFIPIQDPAFEYRMYLPLAGLVALAVFTAWSALNRVSATWRTPLAWSLSIFAVLACVRLTVLRNDDYHSARTLWEDTLAKRPHNPRAYLHFFLGGYLAAPDRSRRQMLTPQTPVARASASEDAGPYNTNGIQLLLAGNAAQAVDAFRMAVRLEPNSPDLHANLGAALEQQGDRDGAIAEYRQALLLNPRHFIAHNNLANALAMQDRLTEAIVHYQSALRLKPDYADVHNNLGMVLVKQGRIEEGLAEFREALRLKPDYAIAHINSGKALTHQGKPQEAIEEYKAAGLD